MMEKTSSSVSVAKCNSKRQDSLKVDNVTSCNKSVTEKRKDRHGAETEVMVERVSSTTELSISAVYKKLSDTAKSVQSDNISNAKTMSQEQRNKEKQALLKIHEKRDEFKSKTSKASHPLSSDDKDKRNKTQLQGTHSASRKDRLSQFHSTVKKRIPKYDKQFDAEVSSSSLVLQSRGSVLPSKAQGKSGLSTYAGGKSTSKRAFPEDSNREMSRFKHSRQDREMHRKGKYEEVLERKIREIRNSNLGKMSSKEMMEREIRNNLKKMGSLESLSESIQKGKERSDERSKEQDNLYLPFLPSSRCCSPPPRPAIVEKYWSDADETEDESDSEKHLLHVNSVNIVLNFLKNNSSKYYVKEEKVHKFNSYEAIRAKPNRSGLNIKERLSNLAGTDSYHPYSKSKYSQGHRRDSYMQGNRSQSHAREPPGRGFSRSRSPVLAEQSSWRDRRSRSPSRHTEFFDRKRSLHPSDHERHPYGSLSSSRVRESSSRNRGSHSPRNRGSHSPTWCEDNRYRRSPSSLRNQRVLQREIGLGSPQRHRATSHRESRSPSRHREGFHRNRESPSHVRYTESSPPYCTECISSDNESLASILDALNPARNRSSFVFPGESTSREREFSPPSFQRYSTNISHHPKDLYFQSVNHQKKSRRGSKNYDAFRGSEPTDSREKHSRPRLSLRDQLLPRGREVQLKEKVSPKTSINGYGFSPLSQHHSSSSRDRHDRHVPFHARHAQGLDTPRSVSREGSVESHVSVMSQESGLGRFTSDSKKKISQKWLEKTRNEIQLPVAFGKKSMKTLKIDEALGWDMNSLPLDKEDQQRKEDVEAPAMDVMTLEDDDEPIIDRPEDYLNASSILPIYRPSFVPDTNDREKFACLDETSELPQSDEDLGVAGPSGTKSVLSPDGEESDDSPHRLSDSKCDQEIEDTDSTVPDVSSSGTSHEAVPSKETVSATSSMLDLSALKDVTTEVAQSKEEKALLTITKDGTTEVAQSEEEKALWTITQAEYSTLLGLIELAKKHTATGKVLPTNLSQVLETIGEANNSKRAEAQEEHSTKNQQEQCSVSQVSKGIQDKSESKENAGKHNKAESVKNDNASTSANKTAEDNFSKNRSIDDGKNVNQVTYVTNKKDSIIPTDKTDEIVFEKKRTDDLSQCKATENYLKSKSKVLEIKTDDKIPKVNKNSKQPPGENIDKIKQQGKDKEKGQSSKNKGDVVKLPSKKQILHKDKEKRQLLKSPAKGTAFERTFTQMQSVKVDLSASHETIASRRRANYRKGTTSTNPRKEGLKQVGKRIYMNESSDDDSDDSLSPNPKKNESRDGSNQPQGLHPLHRETIVLDHSVNLCLACEHRLNPDEFTTISLNIGTVTMRCRNCHTYTKMEKVLSPDYYTTTSISKNVASQINCAAPQTSKTSGPSVDNNDSTHKPSVHNNNSRDHKKENVTSSSKLNKNTNNEGRSLDSNKQARKENKHSSQEVKNNVKEGNSASQKEKEEKLKLADTENASKTVSVSRKDKSHSDRREKGSSSSNKDRNSKMDEEKEILSEFDSIDPHLRVFPWSSSRKRKKISDDPELRSEVRSAKGEDFAVYIGARKVMKMDPWLHQGTLYKQHNYRGTIVASGIL